MATGRNTRASVDSGSPVPTQNHSPDQPYYSLDTFYSILLSRTFNSSTEAITFCRDLCSNHGFTVKQEQSTHKNIYVYCSREGLPDSHRNPKVNPQRNRQSQRCECRWRIVLYENPKATWEFRKSQNADAFIHNHPLLRPEEIKKEWPREVSEKIFELARQRLPTNEIRQQVREQYPDISWDDRRFYNRLSEERQKMKQRDTAMRTIRLVNLSAQICMVNAGSEDLSHYVESKLASLLEDTCKFANVNSNSIAMPVPLPSSTDTLDNIKTESKTASVKQEEPNNTTIEPEPSMKRSSASSSSSSSISGRKSFEALPKGYIAVPIPEHVFHVKMYSQNSAGDIRRAIFDMQRPASTTTSPNAIGVNPHLQYVTNTQPRRRRSRALFAPEEDNDSMDLDLPARKLSRQVASSIVDDELDDMSSQSSPSNSQNLLFATSTHNPNEMIELHQRQQLLSNPQFSITDPHSNNSGNTNTGDLFYNSGNNSSVIETGSNNNTSNTSNSYLHHSSPFQPTHTPPPPPTSNATTTNTNTTTAPTTLDNNNNNNVYPSSGNINPPSNHRPSMHVMYDPNSFVQQQPSSPNNSNDIGLIQPMNTTTPTTERPHSMTFGATTTIPSSSSNLRAQSVSIPRNNPMDPSSTTTTMVRPTGSGGNGGYHTQYAQLQSMMEENDSKRYYSNYRDPLQHQHHHHHHHQQPSSPVPPRTSNSNTQQQQMMSQQQHYISNDHPPHTIFPSYPNSPHHHQTQNIFPTSYMTDEQLLQQQQQHKRKQQYNFNLQQQFERQQHEQQQHLYRRASGPG